MNGRRGRNIAVSTTGEEKRSENQRNDGHPCHHVWPAPPAFGGLADYGGCSDIDRFLCTPPPVRDLVRREATTGWAAGVSSVPAAIISAILPGVSPGWDCSQQCDLLLAACETATLPARNSPAGHR